jgi:HK97 family phage portal protein
MSVIKDFFAARAVKVSDIQNPDLWLTNALSGSTTTSGERVDSEKALSLPAYFACIRCISEDVAKLPLITYRRLERGKERVPDDPVYSLLHDKPNRFMSSMVWRETMLHHALGWGNGYSEIVPNKGNGIQDLLPVHPFHVQIKLDDDNLWYEVRDQADGPRYLKQEQMFHLHGLGSTGHSGYSVLQYAAESIGLGIAAQKFGGSLFGNGIRPSGVLQHPGKLEKEARKNLRESYNSMHGGAENASKLMITEEGIEFKPLSIPPEEAQFLESREFQVSEIARWFRMPPHKIQDLKRATYSNIEQQSLEYVQDTLMPWMVRIEQEIQQKILGNGSDLFAEHLVTGILRGDQAARSTYYREQFNIGALSQNDIREFENMNPIEGGDTYYVPMNMVRTEDASEGGTVMEPGPRPDDNEPGPSDSNNQAEIVKLKRSQVRIFEDAMGRILRKEAKAVTRAIQRNSGSKDRFINWLGRFFSEHKTFMFGTLEPAAVALHDLAGNGRNPKVLVAEFIDRQIDRSQNFFLSVFEKNDYEERIDDLVSTLVSSCAQELMEKICGEN